MRTILYLGVLDRKHNGRLSRLLKEAGGCLIPASTRKLKSARTASKLGGHGGSSSVKVKRMNTVSVLINQRILLKLVNRYLGK